MNYLITGGTGLIGQALIKILLSEHATITVLTRNVNKAQKTLLGNVSMITSLSIEDIELSDIVINLAGEPIADKRWSLAQKNTICQSRWLITKQLVSLIGKAKAPPHLFISGSAIGIYGRQNNQAINEDFTLFHHEFTHEVCQKWEDIASHAACDKTRVVLLRTGIVLAKNKGALAKMLRPFKLGLGGKIADGQQMMSWIHIEDMVKAIIHIIHNEHLHGPINMTAEHAVTNQVFSTTLAAALHRPCLLTTPAPLMKLLFGEMADLLLYGQNIYPKKLIKSHFKFKHSNLDEALQDLLPL